MCGLFDMASNQAPADPGDVRDILQQIQTIIARVRDVDLLVGVAETLQVDIPDDARADLLRLKVLLFTQLMDTAPFVANPTANFLDELYDWYEKIGRHLHPDDDDDHDPVNNHYPGSGVGRGRGVPDDDQRSQVSAGRGRGVPDDDQRSRGSAGRGRGHVPGGLGGFGWGQSPFGGPPDIAGGRGYPLGVGRGGPNGFPGTTGGVGRGRGIGVKAAQSSLFGATKFSTPNRTQTAAGQGGQPGGGGTNVIRRLRDFKIHGQIGNPGQTDKLTYSNLAHQVIAGQRQGYETAEIIAAIIRAIVPGLDLRTYLEGRHDWDLPSVMTILRTHFKERDATAVFTEMSNASQGPDDTEHAFCVRMMGLRDKVMMLTFEEGGYYDERLVQSQFQHALYTGLRSDAARHELRTVLRQPGLTDEQLLVHVNEFMMNSMEHNSKTNGNGSSTAVVSSVNSGNASDGRSRADNKAANKAKESTLVAKMDRTADQVNSLSARVEELTTLVTNHVVGGAGAGGGQNIGVPAQNVGQNLLASANAANPNNVAGAGQTINGFAVGNQGGQNGFFIPFSAFGGGNQPRRRGLCPDCVAAGATQCDHCFKCKQSGHQKSDCPN